MKLVAGRIASQMLGISANTLRKYANNGQIFHIRTPTGQRRYDVDQHLRSSKERKIVCYCRVSSIKQRDDLSRQVSFMQEAYPKAEIIQDIGSGINFKRKGLSSLLDRLASGEKLLVVVAHKDRLARFGAELIEFFIKRNGGELMVLDRTVFSPEIELTQDLLTILHVFSCRANGLRRYKNQVKKDQGISDKATGASI